MVAYLPYFLSTKISEREDAHCYTSRNYRAGLLFRRARLGHSRLRRNISISKDCIKQSIFYTVSRSFVIVWLLTFQLG